MIFVFLLLASGFCRFQVNQLFQSSQRRTNARNLLGLFPHSVVSNLISHSPANHFYFKFNSESKTSTALMSSQKSQTSLQLVEVLNSRPQRAYPRFVEIGFELTSLNRSSFKSSCEFFEFRLLFTWYRIWRGSLVERSRACTFFLISPSVRFWWSI